MRLRPAAMRGGRSVLAWAPGDTGPALFTARVTLLRVLPASSINPASSLTVWNASSGPKTREIVLIVAVLIVLCTSWVYRVLRGPLTVEDIQSHGAKLY